jgi:tetratricopeptide (TPR) repeat protein
MVCHEVAMHRRKPNWRRWSAVSGLSVLLLHLTAAAQAQSPAQVALQKARQFYDNLQYERALGELRRVPSQGLSQEESVSCLLYKGIFLAELLRKEEASAAFKEALSLKPGASLPVEVSPKIRQQFEEVRTALTIVKPPPGKPSSESKPRVEAYPPPPEVPQPVSGGTQTVVQPYIIFSPVTEQKVEVHAPSGATPAVLETGGHTSWLMDPRILSPAGAGGALLVAGGVFWGLARKEYSKIESDDPRLENLALVKDSASHGSTYQTVGFALIGAGLVGLGVAARLYHVDRADPTVDFSIGTTGNQLLFHGRW